MSAGAPAAGGPEPLRILAIGAHPDDCDLKCGGVAALYCDQGHHVTFLSVTNGDAGHHEERGRGLARRRQEESRRAGQVVGLDYRVLDIHDGELRPTLENRRTLIRLIRQVRPDLILSHRPNDYHPDHRYTARLVQDAAFMVTVPNICPETPRLARNPVIAYMSDRFNKPLPFAPDVVVDIGPVLDRKTAMLHCHTSQVYEWLPYLRGELDQVPAAEEARRRWLGEWVAARSRLVPGRDEAVLQRWYGAERARTVEHVEGFEGCEYGSPLTEALVPRLFPFFRGG